MEYGQTTDGYYGQRGEDYILQRVFQGQKIGFFVDVGAFDGVHLSNTYLFELMGWSGICIEAYPEYYALCQKNRPNSMCVHAACIGDATKKQVTFYAERLGLFSSIAPDYEDVAQRYQKRHLEFGGFKKMEVPAVTLNSVLSELGAPSDIEFISIDVEGSEMQVLEGLDLEQFHPRVLLVEANDVEAHRKLNEYLTSQGYHWATQRYTNHFYCAHRRDTRLIAEVPIRKIELLATVHPLKVS